MYGEVAITCDSHAYIHSNLYAWLWGFLYFAPGQYVHEHGQSGRDVISRPPSRGKPQLLCKYLQAQNLREQLIICAWKPGLGAGVHTD